MAMPDHLTHCVRPGSEPVPLQQPEPLQPDTFVCLVGWFWFFRSAPEEYGSSMPGVESELQLPAYTTATVMPDLSRITVIFICAHANAGSLTH